MKKYNGFSLIEVLVAFGIVTMLITTVFPISIQIKKEQEMLSDRITINTTLYDELQQTIYGNYQLDKNYNKQLNNKQLNFHFTTTNDLMEGCVEWINVKHEKEKSCLFGYVS